MAIVTVHRFGQPGTLNTTALHSWPWSLDGTRAAALFCCLRLLHMPIMGWPLSWRSMHSPDCGHLRTLPPVTAFVLR
jgi:hypothetical protein